MGTYKHTVQQNSYLFNNRYIFALYATSGFILTSAFQAKDKKKLQ